MCLLVLFSLCDALLLIFGEPARLAYVSSSSLWRNVNMSIRGRVHGTHDHCCVSNMIETMSPVANTGAAVQLACRLLNNRPSKAFFFVRETVASWPKHRHHIYTPSRGRDGATTLSKCTVAIILDRNQRAFSIFAFCRISNLVGPWQTNPC